MKSDQFVQKLKLKCFFNITLMFCAHLHHQDSSVTYACKLESFPFAFILNSKVLFLLSLTGLEYICETVTSVLLSHDADMKQDFTFSEKLHDGPKIFLAKVNFVSSHVFSVSLLFKFLNISVVHMLLQKHGDIILSRSNSSVFLLLKIY